MNELKENEKKMMLIKDKLFDLLKGDNYTKENAKLYYNLIDKLDELGIKAFDINNFDGKEKDVMKKLL